MAKDLDKTLSTENLVQDLLQKLYSIEGLAQVMQEAHGGAPFTGGDMKIPYSALCLLETLAQDALKLVEEDIRPNLVVPQ